MLLTTQRERKFQNIMNKVIKTCLVFIYINLYAIPFTYILLIMFLGSHNWFNEIKKLDQNSIYVLIFAFSILEFYFLFLAANFKAEKY